MPERHPRQQWGSLTWDIPFYGSNHAKSDAAYSTLRDLINADGKPLPIYVGPRGGVTYGYRQLTQKQFDRMVECLAQYQSLGARLVADVATKKMRLLNTRINR